MSSRRIATPVAFSGLAETGDPLGCGGQALACSQVSDVAPDAGFTQRLLKTHEGVRALQTDNGQLPPTGLSRRENSKGSVMKVSRRELLRHSCAITSLAA